MPTYIRIDPNAEVYAQQELYVVIFQMQFEYSIDLIYRPESRQVWP